MANVIIGTGSYLPARVVTNDDIEASARDFDRGTVKGKSLDEWARQKHGAVSRHRVAPGEVTSDMATVAAKRALADAAPLLGSSDVDLIVLSTLTSDYRLPQAVALVQTNLGSRAKFIQIDAACSGFVDGLLVAHGLMDAHGYETALVIGAETGASVTDPERFLPLTIFGDGAGAVVLRRDPDVHDRGLRSFSSGSDGDLADYVTLRGGGSKIPFSEAMLGQRLQYLELKFADIRPWAVERMIRGTREALDRAGITLADVTWVVPHQASINIIEEVAQRLEVPMDKIIVTYHRTGNTSAASIPIALDYANSQGMFADGDWLIMPAAGAGMVWGAVTCRWYDYRRHAAAAPNARPAVG